MILDIDPKVDYAFKHLFGRASTRPIMIDVLDSGPKGTLYPSPFAGWRSGKSWS